MALQGYNLPLWLKPLLLMVVAQAIIVAINILYKLAAIHAMPTPILVAYRLIFGSISLAPLTIYKSRIKVKPTWKLAFITFVYGSLGGSVYHNLYLASLTLTSATYVSAIVNLTPVITFVLTLTFRLDSLAYHTSAGRAKVLGIILSIGGVVFLSLYKRIELDIWPIKFNIVPQDDHKTEQHTTNQVLGLVFALVATSSNAGFLTIQEMFKDCHKDVNIFLIHFLMNLVGAIQAIVYALCVERDWAQWKLGWNVRLWAASFAGVFGSGLITTLTIWCISKKGPLFVSNFSPVGLILMIFTGSLVLNEKLYLTRLVAIMLIIVGTLLVLWAKVKEAEFADDQFEESVAGVDQAEVALSDVYSIEMPPDAQNDPQSEPNIIRNCILLWFYKIGKSKSSAMISIFFERFCYLASIIHVWFYLLRSKSVCKLSSQGCSLLST